MALAQEDIEFIKNNLGNWLADSMPPAWKP
jgi:hypothetical protein